MLRPQMKCARHAASLPNNDEYDDEENHDDGHFRDGVVEFTGYGTRLFSFMEASERRAGERPAEDGA